MKLKKQNLKIQKNHHGFRRYKNEIEMIIRKNELKIISKKMVCLKQNIIDQKF